MLLPEPQLKPILDEAETMHAQVSAITRSTSMKANLHSMTHKTVPQEYRMYLEDVANPHPKRCTWTRDPITCPCIVRGIFNSRPGYDRKNFKHIALGNHLAC